MERTSDSYKAEVWRSTGTSAVGRRGGHWCGCGGRMRRRWHRDGAYGGATSEGAAVVSRRFGRCAVLRPRWSLRPRTPHLRAASAAPLRLRRTTPPRHRCALPPHRRALVPPLPSRFASTASPPPPAAAL
ncbi:hypothetical protein GUJ93_ZPchr0010g9956 [Zizania palustris]|uniref:Uncharacterized protein n=1 Tax=Zizania palustris TaxID=103762 RepID=A0A8J6BH62_ZIZPA|nr:hypothetical protein GUJ93_ZPchr0010g9956 [Zizania palustris]